jgi:hypothetical protein
MINYFESLGFGDSVGKALNVAQGVQSLSANKQAMQMNESNMQRQQQADQSAMLKFSNDQQKQRAAQGAGAFYNALNSGNTQGALQIASQFQDDINTLGDPSFTVESVAQLSQTPEGVEQLKQMSLGMIQLAAGPEQMARFTAQQQAPSASSVPVSVREQQYYQELQKKDPVAAEAYGRKAGFVETGREQSQTPQERNVSAYKAMIANGDPQAESFGISAGLLSKEGRQLDATTSKALVGAMDEAEQNAVKVTKYLDLANRVSQADIGGGLFGAGGSWREGFKGAFGMQDEEVSKIVSDWQKIRSGEAIASLPQGPATDADIRLALRPLPESPNGEYLASYLRGLSKMASYKETYNQAKADFLSQNGSLRGKDGKNFVSLWKSQREDVLKNIASDPRFSTSANSIDSFLGDGRQQVPAQQQPAQSVGGYKIIEVR